MMTPHEQILEQMHELNPLPDLDAIEDDRLTEITAILDEQLALRSPGSRRVVSPHPRSWLRPAAAFVAALVAVVAAIGIIALLPGTRDDVTDSPATTVTPTEPEPTTAPTSPEPSITDVTTDSTATQQLNWSRIPHDGAVFSGPLVGDGEATSAGMSDVASAHGVFVAVGSGSGVLGPDIAFVDRAFAWYSTDGITWSRAEGDADFDFGESPWPDGGPHVSAVAATSSGFVAVGYSYSHESGTVGAAWTSEDGRSWTRVDDGAGVFDGAGAVEMRDVAASGNLVVAVGRSSLAAAAWRSVDGGATWTAVAHDPAVFGDRTTDDADHDGFGDGLQSINTITATAEGFVAAGIAEVRPRTTEPEFDAFVWWTDSGDTWSVLPDTTGALGGSGDQLVRAIIARPDAYVAVGTERFGGPENPGSRAAAWRSPDLTTWTRVPHDDAIFGADDEATAISAAAVGQTGIVAVGSTGTDMNEPAVWVSSDGLTWARVDDPAFGPHSSMRGVAPAPDGYVLVGHANPTSDWQTAHAAVWTARLP